MVIVGTYPARLLEAEKKNLQFYGFGIKGFTLSMIETAIEVTDGKVSSSRHRGYSRARAVKCCIIPWNSCHMRGKLWKRCATTIASC